MIFHFSENSYKPYKKTNRKLLHINTESNHAPEVLKHILISIDKRLNQNSSDEKIFNFSKKQYEEALKQSYKNFNLKYETT